MTSESETKITGGKDNKCHSLGHKSGSGHKEWAYDCLDFWINWEAITFYGKNSFY